ncbi:MAG: transposase, partial [Acidobacteriota bacterium]|nr:transposase [Acidobacteriota bacterium]
EMIPAYSPQARGRSERAFQTWQGRLPQELRLAGIKSLEEANRFLRDRYIGEFNRRFTVAAAEPGHAFVSAKGRDLEQIFSIQHERTVNRDNTVSVENRVLQIEKSRWRTTLAGCRVRVCEHLDGQLSVCYGPHVVGRYNVEGQPLASEAGKPNRKRNAA